MDRSMYKQIYNFTKKGIGGFKTLETPPLRKWPRVPSDSKVFNFL